MFERISKLRRGFAAVLAVIFLIALFPGAALAGASKSIYREISMICCSPDDKSDMASLVPSSLSITNLNP